MGGQYKYYAFLCYCHVDYIQAEALQKRLEKYRLPARIDNEIQKSRYLRPIYRDVTDPTQDGLDEEIFETLDASKSLLVVCSPSSAHSKWVNQKVQHFIDQGRVKQIVPYIIDGVPMCDGSKECFPPALVEYFRLHPEQTLLGIDAQKMSAKSAALRVAATLLNVPFDALWNRQAHRRRKSIITVANLVILVVALFYYLAVPYHVTIHVHDDRHHLPILKDDAGHVGLIMVDGVEYPLSKLDTTLVLASFPGYYRGGSLVVSFQAPMYEEEYQTLYIGYGVKDDMELQLHRDGSYARFAGKVKDAYTSEPISNALIVVDGGRFKTHTDQNGYFSFQFGLSDQTESKSIHLSAPGYWDNYLEDVTVSVDSYFTLDKRQ